MEVFRSLAYFRRALRAGRQLNPEESANLTEILEWVEEAAMLAANLAPAQKES